MRQDKPVGYSRLQIGLHWAVAALVVLQFLAHEGMEHAWHAFEDGEAVSTVDSWLASLHAFTGLTIFVLALWRVALRLGRGAPPLPENEHPALKFMAHATHFAIYALIIGMPLSGSAAWFLGVEPAADAHGIAATVLFWLVVVHVAGGLAQHFAFRTDVLRRMLVPAK